MDIITLLRLAREKQASDLHLLANNPPVLRIHGSLIKQLDISPFTEEDMKLALKTLATVEGIERFRQSQELDISFAIPDCGRFRINASKNLGTTALVIRILPARLPVISEMGLPPICKNLINKPRGLIIISGPTGSGKSTTLAAMINHLNQTNDGKGKRIVTVEDPVEYVYRNENCLITQRELGSDTQTFTEALRHVLRQDPDVILIGEMRDTDTAAAALTIAETGHLVLTTGHAPSAAGAVERIIDLFPPHERNLVQSRVSTLLVAVLCQVLVPTTNGLGRVAAVEIMLANAAVRNVIREGKMFQLPNVIRTNQQEGMQLLDHALVQLYRQGRITHQEILAFCNDREEIDRLAKNGLLPTQREHEELVSIDVD